MIDERKIELFKELFVRSDSVLIIYSEDASRDNLFASTALYKSISENTKKEISILSPKDLSKQEKDIFYLDETKTEIGNQNLCVSFNYDKDSVDHVGYHISEETNKFYLTIKPKKGKKPLSTDGVDFSYVGSDADMIILVGVDDLESLDQLYYGYENLYQNTSIISINSYETTFGHLKIDILGSSCISEFVSELLFKLEYKINSEIATNLLAGIDEETNNFESFTATADTFEIISKLMRSGARRFTRTNSSENTSDEDRGNEVFAFNNHSKDKVDVKKKTKIKSKPTIKKKIKTQKKKSIKPGDLNYEPSDLGSANI